VNELTELRERLHRLAEDTAPPTRTGLAEVIRTRHRARRRQRAGLVALVAAVAAVVVGGQVLIDGGPTVEPAPLAVPANGSDQTASSPESAGLPPADVYGGPTRGSLADDTAFVDAVQRLPWTGDGLAGSPIPDAPPASRHVVFAGDVSAARIALVTGLNTARPTPPDDDPQRQTDLGALSDTAVAWFVGPDGAPAGGMTLAVVPYSVDPAMPTALFDPATGALVAVGAPGDRLEISLRPDVARDASIHRTWRSTSTTDSVAALDLRADDLTSGQAIRYRVTRGGAEPFVTSPGSAAADVVAVGADAASVQPDRLRNAPPAPHADSMLTAAIDEVLGWTGLHPEDVAFTVLWAGDVPAPTDDPARVTLLAATLPSGAVYLTAPIGVALGGGSVGGTTCGSALLPAGTPPPELTVALRCDATDMSADSRTISSLVVVGPRTAAAARVLDGDGQVIRELTLEDGVAAVPLPDGLVAVETQAADGTVLDRVTPLGRANLGD
jgi:hypothetical protein